MKLRLNIMGLGAMALFAGLLLFSCGGGGGGGGYGSSSAAPTAPMATLDLSILNSGGYYFNVHTVNFPNGEIRGQVAVPAGSSGTITINAPLSGSEEVPPATTTGTGTGTLVIDLGTGQVSRASIAVSGMSSTVTAAHIHQAAAGANGPVVVELSIAPMGGGIGY